MQLEFPILIPALSIISLGGAIATVHLGRLILGVRWSRRLIGA